MKIDPKRANINLTLRFSEPIDTERKFACNELKSCKAENKSNPIATMVTDALPEKVANNPLLIETMAIKIKANVISRRVREPVDKYPFAER